MASRYLAALLTRNDEPPDSVLHQPDIQPAAHQSAVAALVEYGIRCHRKAIDRFHKARYNRENSALFDMKYLHDRDITSLGAVDKRLQTAQKRRQPIRVAISTISKMTPGHR